MTTHTRAALVLIGTAAIAVLALFISALNSKLQENRVVQTSQLASSARATVGDFGTGIEPSPDTITNPSEGHDRLRTLTEALAADDLSVQHVTMVPFFAGHLGDAIQRTIDIAFATDPPERAPTYPVTPRPTAVPRSDGVRNLDDLIREVQMVDKELLDPQSKTA
jgi:hypothetical protein